MKKILYVLVLVTLIIICFLGVTYSYEYNDDESKIFEFIGPSTLYIDVNTEYKEYGIKVKSNGIDISDTVKIDSSSVDTSKFGKYKVKYEIDINGIKEYVYREVIVIDKINPVIKLKGDEEVYVMLGGAYRESGYTVTDNYDTDLQDKVKINGKVNTNKEGIYELEYSVVDSSGNEGKTIRKIIVKKAEITLANIDGNRYTLSNYNVSNYNNTVTKNVWNDDGLYIEGYIKNNSDYYKIKLKNKDNSLEYLYNMSGYNKNYYNGNIDLTKLPNGEYLVFINDERLLNKLDGLTRLLRTKVKNKLVSIVYDNDNVGIIIKDFKYEYDILIDPGHGGYDIGAANGVVSEKTINLKQSMYEKCRFESMGYRVFVTREDDSYGIMLGNSNLDSLQRRALAIGYYGAVSKITYSNHHNASVWNGEHGFEILVSNSLTANDLLVEISLYNKFKEYYKIDDNNVRLYSRDYNTGIIFNKLGGRVYSYMDYYAVIRIPQELFNVKTIIFEPIYMSNLNDFNWYYTNNEWIKVTELKIEEYVNYLGGTYNKDNSMCLN